MIATPSLNQEIDECASTNDIIKYWAEKGAAHGSWISAKRQSSGRGRNQHQWESIEGNLFLSVLLRIPPNFKHWTWLPLLSAIAVVEAVTSHFNQAGLKIKWPNDLYLNAKKAGGILCEGTSRGQQSWVVVGIGLNCLAHPDSLSHLSTHLTEYWPNQKIDLKLLRELIITKLLSRFSNLAENGQTELQREWPRVAFLQPGQEITWKNQESSCHGKVLGLSEFGELTVESSGKIYQLTQSEVMIRPI